MNEFGKQKGCLSCSLSISIATATAISSDEPSSATLLGVACYLLRNWIKDINFYAHMFPTMVV